MPKRTNLLQHASKEDIKQEPYFIDRAVGLPQWQSVMSRVQKIGRLKRKYRITKFSSDEPTEEVYCFHTLLKCPSIFYVQADEIFCFRYQYNGVLTVRHLCIQDPLFPHALLTLSTKIHTPV